jgi:hypothetical protein
VSTLSKPGWSYTFTPEDLLWAAKMIEGEGGDPAAVLWTMASRFALVHGDRFPTFASLIRAYSSPINQRFSPCSAADVAAHPLDCSEAAQARRARFLEEPPDPARLAFVRRWVQGEIPNPVPRAVHFAFGPQVVRCLAREGSDACLEVVGKFPAGRPPERQNWHATTSRTASWPSDYVRIAGVAPRPQQNTGTSSAGGGGGGMGLLLLAAGAAAAFYFGRGLRR